MSIFFSLGIDPLFFIEIKFLSRKINTEKATKEHVYPPENCTTIGGKWIDYCSAFSVYLSFFSKKHKLWFRETNYIPGFPSKIRRSNFHTLSDIGRPNWQKFQKRIFKGKSSATIIFRNHSFSLNIPKKKFSKPAITRLR